MYLLFFFSGAIQIVPIGHLHGKIQKLKRSVNRSIYAVIALAVVVVVLLIALIAVGASQQSSIRDLKQKAGIVKNPYPRKVMS